MVLGTVYFLITFLYRRYFLQQKRGQGLTREELAPIVSNFLFHSNTDPIEEQRHFVELKIKIRARLHKRSFRKVLSGILFDLQKDVSGHTRKRLLTLYRELELHNDAVTKLHSWRWEIVSQGIMELTQMQVEEAYGQIVKYVNDPRKTVRKQAELSIVALRKEGLNFILDNAQNPISEWQQLKLMEALGNHSEYQPPKFKSWLLSGNNDVVLFSLRLIRHFNQKDADKSIIELVKHKNDTIKLEAIQCIKEFNVHQSLPVLKKVFWRVNPEIKLNILATIADLGDQNDLLFLEEVSTKSLNHLVKSKARGAMSIIKPDSVLPINDIEHIKEHHIPQLSRNDITAASLDLNVEYEVEPGDGISPIMREEIEFTEIEVFDLVEKPKVEWSNLSDTEHQEIAPDFELNLMDEGSDQFIGIDASLDNEVFDKEFDILEFEERYSKMEYNEKEKLLNSIIDYGDAREKGLLQSIVALEENSELRFAAFGKLKELQNGAIVKKSPQKKDTGELLPKFKQSIFCHLFEHTKDEESKLLLVKEMAEVGDFKEIPFLESLLDKDLGKELKTSIEETILLIENKYLPSEILAFEPLCNDCEEVGGKTTEEERKIPLELFSLYEEIGIENHVEALDVSPEFELAGEVLSNHEPLKHFHNG